MTFAQFANQMSEFPRLTLVEELELGKQVQADFIPLQGVILEAKDRPRFLRGKRARDRMALSNFRLVMKIANKYRDRGVPVPDLVQEGEIGLLKAIDKFDPTKGYRFSTYAYWWINQGIQRAIFLQSRTIKIPVHKWEIFYKILGATKELQAELQVPTVAAIAAKTNFSIVEIEDCLQVFKHPLSMDAPIPGTENLMFDSVVPASDQPWDFVGQNEAVEIVDFLLAKVSRQQQLVLRRRVGEEKPIKEIAAELEVSESRIKTVSKQSKEKLRGAIASMGYEFPLEA